MLEHRYPELDALRGIAVWMMVLYHLLFDLAYFYGWQIPIYDGGWKIFARTAAILFLLLVGVCFVISWERSLRAVETPRWGVSETRQRRVSTTIYGKYLRRGLFIFGGGMVISLVTKLFAGDMYVRFGVLHLIGFSTLLLPFFTPLKEWNALLGLFIITFYTFTPSTPPTPSLDYFPLLPWLGVILIGMALGHIFYSPSRLALLQKLDSLPYPRALLWSGRRSLWIYFVHQPVLLIFLGFLLGMQMG